MTRKEIAVLLSKIRPAYPNTKDIDVAGLIDTWELAFGDEDAGRVYKAARVHMRKSKFFPTPADIVENMARGDILYGENAHALEAPKAVCLPEPVAPMKSVEAYCKGACICPYFESEFCFGTKEEYDACTL